MKKRFFLFFSVFILLGGVLVVSSSRNPIARAAEINSKPFVGSGFFTAFSRPPAKMCVGEEYLVAVGYLKSFLTVNHVVASASNGTLTKSNWTIPGGFAGRIFNPTYKATEPGKAVITFGVTEGGVRSLLMLFEVVACKYHIEFSGVEVTTGDPASFRYILEGNGEIDASKENDSLSGTGTYTASLYVTYQFKSEGVTCITAKPAKGKSSFKVTGKESGTVLNISLTFQPVDLKDFLIKCKDKNGRETKKDLPPVFEGKSDTQQFLPLTGLTIAPRVAYKFKFSNSGQGSLTVNPRSKS
jgi:hypothetical protein